MSAFRHLGEREVFKGKIMTVVEASFEAPDGTTFSRDVVRHPGAVSIVPLVEEGTTAILVRQYRAPLDRFILEIPAGLREDDDESPEATARRELEEEVGMRAGRLEKLAGFYNTAGSSDLYTWVYLGLDLEPCGTSLQGVEEEHMTIEHVLLDDVPRLIADGTLSDAKTVIGLLLAREALA